MFKIQWAHGNEAEQLHLEREGLISAKIKVNVTCLQPVPDLVTKLEEARQTFFLRCLRSYHVAVVANRVD